MSNLTPKYVSFCDNIESKGSIYRMKDDYLCKENKNMPISISEVVSTPEEVSLNIKGRDQE